MTVEQLIDLLQKMPRECQVIIRQGSIDYKVEKLEYLVETSTVALNTQTY